MIKRKPDAFNIGGPLARDRTFFFSATKASAMTVPDALAHQVLLPTVVWDMLSLAADVLLGRCLEAAMPIQVYNSVGGA